MFSFVFLNFPSNYKYSDRKDLSRFPERKNRFLEDDPREKFQCIRRTKGMNNDKLRIVRKSRLIVLSFF